MGGKEEEQGEPGGEDLRVSVFAVEREQLLRTSLKSLKHGLSEIRGNTS